MNFEDQTGKPTEFREYFAPFVCLSYVLWPLFNKSRLKGPGIDLTPLAYDACCLYDGSAPLWSQSHFDVAFDLISLFFWCFLEQKYFSMIQILLNLQIIQKDCVFIFLSKQYDSVKNTQNSEFEIGNSENLM